MQNSLMERYKLLYLLIFLGSFLFTPIQAQVERYEILHLKDAIVISEYLPCPRLDSTYIEGNHYLLNLQSLSVVGKSDEPSVAPLVRPITAVSTWDNRNLTSKFLDEPSVGLKAVRLPYSSSPTAGSVGEFHPWNGRVPRMVLTSSTNGTDEFHEWN